MIERTTIISCDGSCDSETFISGANAREVKRQARADNWLIKSYGHYCRNCHEYADHDAPSSNALNDNQLDD